MVETIAPVVHGDRRSKYRVSLLVHALGSALAAGLVGAAAGGLGRLLGAPWEWGWITIAALALLYVVREATGLRVPIPDRHQQVPLWWRSFYSPGVSSFLYGFGLGIGYLTYLSFGTYVVVTGAAFASGEPLVGALISAPFGIGRAISIAVANARTSEDQPSGIDRVDDLAATRWPKVANGLVLLGVAAVALLALA